jgi:serine/threonine protein kinase
LCLNPDVIFLRFDKEGIPRPLLLDLGIGDINQDVHNTWTDGYNLPAYTAPEVLEPGKKVEISADVYGIGLVLYEMLAGRPAFAYHLKKDDMVYQSVLTGEHKPSGRIDLKGIPDIVEKAIHRQPAGRYADVLAMANELKPFFPPIPAEKKPRKMNWKMVFIVIGALLAISLILVFVVSLIP